MAEVLVRQRPHWRLAPGIGTARSGRLWGSTTRFATMVFYFKNGTRDSKVRAFLLHFNQMPTLRPCGRNFPQADLSGVMSQNARFWPTTRKSAPKVTSGLPTIRTLSWRRTLRTYATKRVLRPQCGLRVGNDTERRRVRWGPGPTIRPSAAAASRRREEAQGEPRWSAGVILGEQPPTWHPSKPEASPWTNEPISGPSASCSMKWSPASALPRQMT